MFAQNNARMKNNQESRSKREGRVHRHSSKEFGDSLPGGNLLPGLDGFDDDDDESSEPIVHSLSKTTPIKIVGTNVSPETKAGNNARLRRGRYSLTERLKADNPVQFPMEQSVNQEAVGADSNKVVPVGGGGEEEESKSDSDKEGVKKEDSTSDPNPPQIEKKKSNAQKNWGKIRTAQKMTAVFKEVDKDVKMFGSSKDDSHIDWSEVYKTQERENRLPLGIIDPSSTFRNSWDLFMSFILLYIAFYVPYRVCLFWDDDNLSDNLQTIETISDILFGIDIILNFSTAYVDKKTGELIVSRRKIAIYYCKGYFIIDLVASFPFQILTDGGGQALSKSGKVLRLPKLIKFLRLFRLLKLMRIYRLRQLMTRLQAEYNIHHGFSRMIKIVLMVLLVTHLVGCLWFMIGRTGGDDPIDGGWMWRYQLPNHTIEAQYVTCLYWAFSTLTTVGYGDISARTPQEQIYSMWMMLLGVSWYAYIVSSMSTIMASFDRQNKAIKEKTQQVNAFIHDAKLPADTAKQIRRFYEFALTANKNKGLMTSNQYDADSILDELSSNLRSEILLFVERVLIEKIPFFKGKIPQFVADCITMFQPMVFQEGDFIIKEGSAADEMYFLTKGRCAVYYGSKRMVSIIEGSYFGEIGCIMGGIRRAGIKALTVCELQALSRRNLNILLAEYPMVGDELKQVAKKRVHAVRTSIVQKKQVDGVRKMLGEREKHLSKNSPGNSPAQSPKSPNGSISDHSPISNSQSSVARARIDSLIRKQGGGNEVSAKNLSISAPAGMSPTQSSESRHSITSGPVRGGGQTLERTMSMTSGNLGQGNAFVPTVSDDMLKDKKKKVEANILKRMTMVTDNFVKEKGGGAGSRGRG
ncbi:hypothetical protein TL16_g05580 [Triparma laevis f. inornata]|uniref:Cyclic nucleotide-binding domain-containing protein n=1 Tax=Triparma laevis f. inornata TaxID=1714386 RepID=A0A9W7EAN6_9STRA|nr:hypothetical protein TL16_g05580 [Triparma laevis f. inornata]